MEKYTLSHPALRVFISNHDHHLSAERSTAQRVLSAFQAGQFTDDLSHSDIYVGLFEAQAELETIQEFETAMRSDKTCWFFLKEAPQRDPQLIELIRHVAPLYPPRTFQTASDLAFQLWQALGEHLQQTDGWLPPPLPLRSTHFVGRAEELRRLEGMFNSTHPITLSGEAGVGKTTLAIELAYRLRHYFTGGIFWLDSFGNREGNLQTGKTVQQTLRELAQTHPLGRIAVAEGRQITASELRGWLAETSGKALVIADDMRQMQAIRDLRAALPTTYSLLVTSSAPLNEVGWNTVELAPLKPEEGFQLLTHFLETPSGLAPEAARPLKTIAEMLQENPLALRLAMGWMQQAGGWQSSLIYLTRLTESTKPLQQITAQISHKHPVEKTVGLLYNSLTPRQKQLVQAMSAFAPNTPFTGEALWRVADLAPIEDDLKNLTVALLHVDEEGRGYRLHERLQSYTRLLTTESDFEGFQGRHLAYYEQQAAYWSGEKSTLKDLLPPDLRQLRHALRYAAQTHPQRLMDYVLTAGQYLQLLHYPTELKDWLDLTLETVSKSSRQYKDTQPTTLRALGDLAVRVGHTMAAQEFYEGALLLYYESRSLSGQANTLKALGDLRATEGHLTEAQDFYDRTLLLYAQIDFQLGRANTLKAMGDLSLKSGDLKAARNHYQRTLELYEQIDFQLGQAHTVKAMADLHVQERDYVEAKRAYHQALQLYHEINFPTQQALTLIDLGKLYQLTAQPEPALEQYQTALRLYRQAEDSIGQAQTWSVLGSLHYEGGRYAAAREAYDHAIQFYREKRAEMTAAETQLELAETLMALSQSELAVRTVLDSLKTFHRLEQKEALQAGRRYLRKLAQRLGSQFPVIWGNITKGGELPEWLKLAPSTAIEQRLVYAVRDFMTAANLQESEEILTRHQEVLLTDEADEVLARMLRQYAGQVGPTRQVDRYRSILQRARQVGVEVAFAEARSSKYTEADSQARRLRQTLDNYDEALNRLRDIPLVYASIQLNRANTLRELAEMPHQDRMSCLQDALAAYNDALQHQDSAPLDYAQTQILRAETLQDLAALPDADVRELLEQTLEAYTDALQHQHDLPAEYALTQFRRADTLYQLSLQPSEATAERMQQALEAYDDTLTFQTGNPVAYAKTQSHRARLLYAMAGLPQQNFIARMREALTAYDETLIHLREADTLEYARTLTYRMALLRDMAGLPGEDRGKRLYEALATSNEALRFLANSPKDYAQAQIHRAHLQRELAGLRGEHRLARMRESLATYTEVLTYVSEAPLEYASVQNSRASLLREMSGLGGENQTKRLREALEAVAEALLILDRLPQGKGHLANTRRMMTTIRKEIVGSHPEGTFDGWWREILGTQQPDWLKQ